MESNGILFASFIFCSAILTPSSRKVLTRFWLIATLTDCSKAKSPTIRMKTAIITSTRVKPLFFDGNIDTVACSCLTGENSHIYTSSCQHNAVNARCNGGVNTDGFILADITTDVIGKTKRIKGYDPAIAPGERICDCLLLNQSACRISS